MHPQGENLILSFDIEISTGDYQAMYQTFNYGDRVECSVTGETGTIIDISWDENNGFSYMIKRDWNDKPMWRTPQGVKYLKKIEEKENLSFEF